MAEYQERVALALEALVPLAWMTLTSHLPAERRPQPEDLATSEERHQMVGILCMSDGLATGDFRGSKKSQLSNLAKAICVLSCAPGGVTIMGRKWEVGFRGGRWWVMSREVRDGTVDYLHGKTGPHRSGAGEDRKS